MPCRIAGFPLQEAAGDLNVENKDKIFKAAEDGDTETAKELINAKADLNVLNWNGDTPLMMAIKRRHTETAKELINAKADVNVKNRNGVTALILAAEWRLTEIVKELINDK